MWSKEPLVLVFTVFIACVSCRRYLKEKPGFVTPCESRLPTFNECYRKNLQAVISEWKYGIPGIPSAGRFEPVNIRRLLMEQTDLKIEMHNITIKGLGSTEIVKLILNTKDLTIRIKAQVPKIELDGEYLTQGRILFLPLNGHGECTIIVEKANFLFLFKIALHREEGFIFADVENVRTKIKEIGGFHIKLDNLFNGNKQLEEHTNEIFNTNWRDFLDILRPTLEDSINSVIHAHFKKLLGAIPANYMVSDIESYDIAVV